MSFQHTLTNLTTTVECRYSSLEAEASWLRVTVLSLYDRVL